MMMKMMRAMMGSMSGEEKQDNMIAMMPEMMKCVKGSEMAEMCRDLFMEKMVITQKSRFPFMETVEMVRKAGLDSGWYNPQINNHFEIEKDLGLDNPNRCATVSMCLPRSAHEILKEDLRLGIMMPLQINVYEQDRQVYVGWLNIQMMGKMFGEKISEVMAESASMVERVLKEIFVEDSNGND